jgi:hypothetical protein
MAEFTCGECRTILRAPVPVVADYGTLTYRSEGRGTLAIVNALEDPTFDEISHLTEQLQEVAAATARERGAAIQWVFGATADYDIDGSRFGVDFPPRCPNCESNNVVDFTVIEPPEFVDVELPLLSHDHWSGLDEPDKMTDVRQAAAEFFSSLQ